MGKKSFQMTEEKHWSAPLGLLCMRIPPRSVRTSYAFGIVNLFPYLQDPYSKHGYVSLFDVQKQLFSSSIDVSALYF